MAESVFTAIEKMKLANQLQQLSMGSLDLSKIRHSDLVDLQRLLTPKMNKYIPHVPTPKQAAFLLLNCKEAFYHPQQSNQESL